MAEKQTSQSQKKTTAENETSKRVGTMMDEIERFEARGIEHTQRALAAWSELANAQMDYMRQLSAQWRQVVLDASHR